MILIVFINAWKKIRGGSGKEDRVKIRSKLAVMCLSYTVSRSCFAKNRKASLLKSHAQQIKF